MRSATKTDERPATARALDAVIRRRGFVPGPPPGCEGLICLDYRPYHDGRDGYRVVAACPACGAGEEV